MRRLLLIALLGFAISNVQAQVKTKVKIIEQNKTESSVESDTVMIIRSGDTIIQVNEELDVDEVNVALRRFNISVGANGVRVTKNDSIKHKKVVTRFLLLDIGFAGYLQDGSFNLSPQNEFLDTRGGKSRNVNLQLFTQRVRFAKNHANFSYGLMFEFNKYRLANNVQLIPGEAPLSYIDLDKNLRKNKLKATYLYVPLMLGYESNPEKVGKSFRVRAGLYGGILVSSKQKLIGKITDRTKIRDDFNLTKFRYGLRGEIGYGWVNFYVHYAFSPMFKDGQGPLLHPINFGFMLLPF